MVGCVLRDTGLALGDLCALARGADDAGCHSIWIPEVASRDALALATLLGAETRRAMVGTGVIPVFSRNPVSLALAAATAAEAARGRFVLGLGAGHRFVAESWFGAHWQRPLRHLRETVEIVRRILDGERVSYHGCLRVDGFHLGTTPPRVPIALGALSPATLRLAGQVADAVILNWLPPEGMARSALLAREAAADAGRSIQVLGYVRVAVVEDEEEEHQARAALREHAYSYALMPVYARSMRTAGLGRLLDRLQAGEEKALDELVDALCLCGGAEEIRKGLAAYREAGLDVPVVYPVPFGENPAAAALRTIRAAAG